MPTASLTLPQVEHYRREGYLLLPGFFDAAALAGVDAGIRELTRQALTNPDAMEKVLELEPELVNGQPVPRRIYHPFHAHDAFRALASAEPLLDCIQALIGPSFSIQHSKLNMKPPRVGSVVDWHQDLAYFPHTNDDLVTALIYLDDASEENGCLQVLPRHHHHYFDHFLPDGTFGGMITEDLSGDRFGKPVSLEGPAGSVILMHCITPHASLPNLSPRGRRTLIFEYRAADSFPIYFGGGTASAEALAVHLRGTPARTARFGGPPPLIPDTKKFNSLYERQAHAKAALARR